MGPVIRIDAHQHCWQPLRGDYDWMPQGDPVLDRVWGPADLQPHLTRHGIDRTILVQAAATVDETEYMLGIADATPHVAGVVGWIDFEDPGQERVLRRLARHPKFKGVRPMIQDIPDVDWMLRPDVQWAYQAIIDSDLTFDALGFPQHLANFSTLIRRYPDLRVVIDHCMKPQIRNHTPALFRGWADAMTALAGTQAFVKLSGLVTEAKPGWRDADLEPYARHVLDAFGPDRVMWGSDWPVCTLNATYADWLACATELSAHLDPAAQAALFGGTAARFYRVT
jgi:L-fuconolactonase